MGRDMVSVSISLDRLAELSDLPSKELPGYLADLQELGLISTYYIEKGQVRVTAPKKSQFLLV